MKIIGNLLVARRDVRLTAPSHVRGVPEGNDPGSALERAGIEFEAASARAHARRSTGICADEREPIDPRMPRLTPA